MEVYGDVYFILNALCDTIVLFGCGAALGIGIKKKRLFMGGLAGGAFALLSLYLYPHTLLIFLLSLVVSALMILLSFGFGGIRRFSLLLLVFHLCSFFFSGAVQFLSSFLRARLSPFLSSLFLLASLFCALFLLLLFFSIEKAKKNRKKVTLTFTYNENIYTLSGFADSGNLLSDKETGLPVVVVARSLFGDLPSGARELKVSTISSDCSLSLLLPDSLFVNGNPRAAILGLCTTRSRFAGCDALVPFSLI